MREKIEAEAVVDAEVKPDAAASSPDTEGTKTDTTGTPETPVKAFDPASISPDTKAYFDKQYADHGKYKEMASEYEQMLRTREFQEWYQGLRKPKEQKFEISDDEFVGALSDKGKFSQLISALAEKIATEKLGPQLEQVQAQANLANRTNELNRTLAKYPDFQEMLDQKGLLEGYVNKYPNLGWDEIYKLAKWENFNEEVDKRARGLVDSKKAASVEKPGATTGAKSRRIKAKNSLEAMEIAAEAFKAGREAPEIDFE